MTREEKIYIMDTFKEKKYVPRKCFWKYFFNGVFSVFSPQKAFQKHCPHCCSIITDEEYFEIFGVFTYGCDNCKEKL